MALKATIHKARLTISDLVRQYYADHALTVALHPSETEERMIFRLLAFALFAGPDLKFTRGLSTVEEPDLWQHDASGGLALWIDLGQPDPRRLRQACGKARRVAVVAYGGRSAEQWWQKNRAELARLANLTVLYLSVRDRSPLAAMAGRNMELNLTVADDRIWLSCGERTLDISVERWQA